MDLCDGSWDDPAAIYSRLAPEEHCGLTLQYLFILILVTWMFGGAVMLIAQALRYERLPCGEGKADLLVASDK